VPDIEFAGYPACRISGLPDIWPAGYPADQKSRISGLLRKELFSQQQVIKVLPVFKDTGTGYDEIFEKLPPGIFS